MSANLDYVLVPVTDDPPNNGKFKVDTNVMPYRCVSIGRIPAGAQLKVGIGTQRPVPVEQGMSFLVEGPDAEEAITYIWTKVCAGEPDGNDAIIYLGDGVVINVPARVQVPG